jgi:FkbM family methyltransferase
VTIPTGVAKGSRWIIQRSYPTQFARGDWDLPFQQVLAALLGEGDVFFDVGANAGFHMLVGAALVGPTGRVIGFEPLDANCRAIGRVLELNQLSGCEVARLAVGDKVGEVTFFEHPLNALGSTVRLHHSRGVKQYRVPATTLDAFIEDRVATIGRPSAIKIDVEGAEELVIEGARTLLAHAAPPALLVELHEPTAGAAVIRRLTEHGFSHAWLDGEASAIDDLSPMHVGHIVAVSRTDPRLHTLRAGIGESWQWSDA